jgi:hypothetical protein
VHLWFQAAREGRDNPFHDFYVWADEKPVEKPGDVVFPDQENSNWAYDRKAKRWFLHRFYSHQPDLDVGRRRHGSRSRPTACSSTCSARRTSTPGLRSRSRSSPTAIAGSASAGRASASRPR